MNSANKELNWIESTKAYYGDELHEAKLPFIKAECHLWRPSVTEVKFDLLLAINLAKPILEGIHSLRFFKLQK